MISKGHSLKESTPQRLLTGAPRQWPLTQTKGVFHLCICPSVAQILVVIPRMGCEEARGTRLSVDHHLFQWPTRCMDVITSYSIKDAWAILVRWQSEHTVTTLLKLTKLFIFFRVLRVNFSWFFTFFVSTSSISFLKKASTAVPSSRQQFYNIQTVVVGI